MLEGYVRQAFDISRGRWSVFYKSGISVTLLALIVVLSLFPVVAALVWKKAGKPKPAGPAAEGGGNRKSA